MFTQGQMFHDEKKVFSKTLANARKGYEPDIVTLTKTYRSEAEDIGRARISYRGETGFERGQYRLRSHSARLLISPPSHTPLPNRRYWRSWAFPRLGVVRITSVVWVAASNEYFSYDIPIRTICSLAYGQYPIKEI